MTRELITVNSMVVVENGPKRKTVVATDETLANTASPKRYYLGGKDAMGKTIVKGEEFTFLDSFNDWEWNVYKMNESTGRYEKVAAYSDKDEAVAQAEALEV